jgi:hypothetical protein
MFIASAQDTYFCCAAYFQTSGCGTYDFVPRYGSQSCELDLFNQCPAGQTQSGWYMRLPIIITRLRGMGRVRRCSVEACIKVGK